MTTYGVLNIAAGVEQFLGSPSFRPRFRVHWAWSLLGTADCVAVMLLINALATAVAAVVVLSIFIWLEQRELRTAWGDVRQGVWMMVTRVGLLRLRAPEPKNRRPHLLVLSGASTKRWHLIELVNALTHNRALLTVSTVVTDPSITSQHQARMEATIGEYLEKWGVQTLLRLIRAPDPFAGAERLVEAYGLGPLIPNTVLLGDSEDDAIRGRYCSMLRHIHEAKRNLVVVHHHPTLGLGNRRRIDVWWGGLKHNGGLMMTLAYLLRTGGDWREAEVCVKMVVPSETGAEDARANLAMIIAGLRMGATAEVIVAQSRTFDTILRTPSAEADLVLLGMKEPEGDGWVAYYEDLRARATGLPTVAFVLAAENLEFGEILV